MSDDPTPPQARPARSVCVYCGSSSGARPEYAQMADAFGAGLARRGMRMVFGGGSLGLMGRCADAARLGGGAVFGVFPRFLGEEEVLYEAAPYRLVDTMHERKQIMFDESDAFAALPGGVGTLDELVEVLSWRRLDMHAKPIVLVDRAFWAPFAELMTRMAAAGFVAPDVVAGFYVAADVADAFAFLSKQPGFA